MNLPNPEDIQSEFQVLDEEYHQDDFYGGAFEGSHAYTEFVILRLYSIIPQSETDQLRIETRQHYAGQVIDHRQSHFEMTSDRQICQTNQPLKEFCRSHHFKHPYEELTSLISEVADSDKF